MFRQIPIPCSLSQLGMLFHSIKVWSSAVIRIIQRADGLIHSFTAATVPKFEEAFHSLSIFGFRLTASFQQVLYFLEKLCFILADRTKTIRSEERRVGKEGDQYV